MLTRYRLDRWTELIDDSRSAQAVDIEVVLEEGLTAVAIWSTKSSRRLTIPLALRHRAGRHGLTGLLAQLS